MKSLFMLSCSQAAALIHQQAELPLSSGNRLKLAFHLRMCAACKAYQKDQRLIEARLRQGNSLSAQGMTPEEAERILNKIKTN